MRALTYYVACTADGFIARADGSFDFFPTEGEHLRDLFDSFPETIPGLYRTALGISGENKRFDAVLMGRRTYEVGLREGNGNPYPHMKQYLISRTMQSSPDPEVELVAGDVLAFVRGLKGRSGKDLWLCGGAELAAALSSEIDELILKVNPIVLGSGIPLFAGAVGPLGLELAASRTYRNGFMLHRYRVKR